MSKSFGFLRALPALASVGLCAPVFALEKPNFAAKESASSTPDSYWADQGNHTASPVRVGRRFFVGGMTGVPGNYAGKQTGSHLSGIFAGDWPQREALVAKESPNGHMVDYNGAKTSDAAGSPNASLSPTIVSSDFVVNDVTSTTRGFSNAVAAWARYQEAVAYPGAGYTTAMEVDVASTGTDRIKLYPYFAWPSDFYAVKGLTAREYRCGGSLSSPVTYGECSAVANIGSNGGRFKTGINFMNGSLVTDGAGNSDAVQLGAGMRLDWYRKNNTLAFFIKSMAWSDAQTATGGIEFDDYGTRFWSGSRVALYLLTTGNLATPNHLMFVDAASALMADTFGDAGGYHVQIGGQPRLDVTGNGLTTTAVSSYDNAALNIFGQGTGSVCLGTSLACRWFVSAATGAWLPNEGNTYDIASNAARVKTVYAATTDAKVHQYSVGPLPASPVEGMCAWDGAVHKLKCYDGSAWQSAW